MMITAGAVLGTVLTRCTVRLTWHTCPILHIYREGNNISNCQRYLMQQLLPLTPTFKVTVGTNLQTNGKISNMQVCWRACEAAVRSSSCARFAGIMAWPAYAHLIWKRARRATTNAGAAHANVKQYQAISGR